MISSRNTTLEYAFLKTNVSAPSNDMSLISKETRKLVEMICFSGLTTLVCLIGIPANIINCIVFWRQGLKDRMNLCLFSLAITDLAYLASELAVLSLSSFLSFIDPTLGEEYMSKAMVDGVGTIFSFRLTSGFINMLISIERCLCVLFPLHALSLIRTSTLGILIIIILFAVQTSYLIIPMSLRAVLVNTTGSARWFVVYTQFALNNRIFVDIFGNIILGAAIPTCIFFIISGTTVVTVTKLTAAMKWRKSAGCVLVNQHHQQRALTTMLVLVSCIYIFTAGPNVARELIRILIPALVSDPHYYDLFLTVSAVTLLPPRLNSSIHIFVYYNRSSRYRSVLRKTLCGCGKKQPFASDLSV